MTETVVRIAARGDGVTDRGRHLAGVAPGDTVAATGEVVPGPHRAVPPCSLFPACGGCQLQQLDEPAYADFVRDRVVGALAAQGLEADVANAIVSPPRTRRRATLHAERVGGRVVLGFTEGASHRIVDCTECHILDPALFALVAPLRRLLATIGLRGRADVQLTFADQGVDLMLKGAFAETLAATEAVTAFARTQGLARVSIDQGLGPETRWEPDRVTVILGGVAVAMPPGAFLQATRDGEAVLVDAVRAIVGDVATVADLFAGLGTFALALSGGARVYAAEAARDAIVALKGAAAQAGRTVFAEHRDLFRRPLSADEASRFDAVVLDPPRAGAREQVAALAMSRVSRIAYVSCNPSSFARDAKALCETGYRLEAVQPVGQFRWSTHIELVAAFRR